MAIVTPLYVVLGVTVLLWIKSQGNAKPWEENLPEIILLTFSGVRFFLWYKIFSSLRVAFERLSRRFLELEGKKISKFLYTSFIVDAARAIYSWRINYSYTVDWTRVQWPDVSVSWPEYLIMSVLYFFKITVLGSGFLTPTVHGVGALMLGVILDAISSSSLSNENPSSDNIIVKT